MTADDDGLLVPPLMVADGWDLMFFRSLKALGGYLEPWGLPSNADYRAWDAQGRRLTLVVINDEPPRRRRRRWSVSGVVSARLAEDQNLAPDELVAYLRDWFGQVGAAAPPPNTPLPELVLHALMHGDLC
jgi:hypothetical protein